MQIDERGFKLSPTERISLVAGTIVSMITLLGSVWYAAIAATNVTRDLQDTQKLLTQFNENLKSNTSEVYVLKEDVKGLKLAQAQYSRTTPTILYVNDKYILLGTPSGEPVKVSIYRD